MRKYIPQSATPSDSLNLPATYSHRDVREIIDESEALRRVPVSRRTWFDWKKRRLIPYIKLPGSRRTLFHWPSVQEALLRQQRGSMP